MIMRLGVARRLLSLESVEQVRVLLPVVHEEVADDLRQLRVPGSSDEQAVIPQLVLHPDGVLGGPPGGWHTESVVGDWATNVQARGISHRFSVPLTMQ